MFGLKSSDTPAKYISCPVSPTGSPLLYSRSPRHGSGGMSPSPISSPMATSGASTPMTGGNGALPFSQRRHGAHLHDGLVSSSRCIADFYPNGAIYNEPKVGHFLGMQHGLPNLSQRKASEADIRSPLIGRVGKDNPRDPCKRHLFVSDGMSYPILRDQVKLKSVDHRGGSNLSRR